MSEIRFVNSSLPGNKRSDLLYHQDSLVEDNLDLIKQLTRVPNIRQEENPTGLRLAVFGREVWLDVPQKVMAEHRTNLEMRLADMRREAQIIEGRLDNESYVAKAPASLVEDSRRQLSEKLERIDKIATELENFS